MEDRKIVPPVLNIAKALDQRRRKPTKKEQLLIKDRALIQRIMTAKLKTEASEQQIIQTIAWLEKVSKYVPITSDKELEEIIKIMVLLSQERAKYNELYDYPGLELMKQVREGMIRYMVVLSELRAHQKEFLEHWFTDEYWIAEWCRILLNLAPEDKMVKYGYENINARDFIFLLELELACADDASQVEKPMIRLQPIENKKTFLIIPTENAAEEYEIQVNRIENTTVTFTEWVRDTLKSLKLPK